MASGMACSGRACRAVMRVAKSDGGIDEAVRIPVLVESFFVLVCEIVPCRLLMGRDWSMDRSFAAEACEVQIDGCVHW